MSSQRELRRMLGDMQCQLDGNPSNWDLRLVMADLLSELSKDGLAAGQRWQARHQKRPEIYLEPPGTWKAFWGRDEGGSENDVRWRYPHCILPGVVYLRLRAQSIWEVRWAAWAFPPSEANRRDWWRFYQMWPDGALPYQTHRHPHCKVRRNYSKRYLQMVRRAAEADLAWALYGHRSRSAQMHVNPDL